MKEWERSPGVPIEDEPQAKPERVRQEPVRMPVPPGYSPKKWAAMPRRERRAVQRQAIKFLKRRR